MNVIIVGGGVFGLTAAISLRQRGHSVRVIEFSGFPSLEDADESLMDVNGIYRGSSVDVSRIIRADYGDSTVYVDMMEDAFPLWREWNKEFNEELFHEVGFLLMYKEGVHDSNIPHEALSYLELSKRGWPLQEVYGSKDLLNKYPAWNGSTWTNEELQTTKGYFNPIGGYAHNGRTIAYLKKKAYSLGVEFILSNVIDVKPYNVTLYGGIILKCDHIIVAAGAFTDNLLPEMKSRMTPLAQPIFYIEPKKEIESLFESSRFPCFSADTQSGYYGFCKHSMTMKDGTKKSIVKIARHGYGQVRSPGSSREVEDKDAINHFEKWLPTCFPSLVGSPYKTRVCFYCDTHDFNFYICPLPNKEGITIATGGSGHGFKFAPVLGNIIADVVEKKDNKYKHAFQWRDPTDTSIPHGDTMRTPEIKSRL